MIASAFAGAIFCGEGVCCVVWLFIYIMGGPDRVGREEWARGPPRTEKKISQQWITQLTANNAGFSKTVFLVEATDK